MMDAVVYAELARAHRRGSIRLVRMKGGEENDWNNDDPDDTKETNEAARRFSDLANIDFHGGHFTTTSVFTSWIAVNPKI